MEDYSHDKCCRIMGVEIKCDIFQNDALSPLLFIPVLIPQTITCNKKENHTGMKFDMDKCKKLLICKEKLIDID